MDSAERIASAGLHHVTAIAGAARRNHDFYTATLGLRLVKKTVNFDDPGTYHLYYADHAGSPGSVITFFPWANAAPGRLGSGEAGETAFAVAPERFDDVAAGLSERGVATESAPDRFGAKLLRFADPDGMRLALISDPSAAGAPGVAGFHSVSLDLADIEPTAAVMRHVLGWDETARDDQSGEIRVRYSAPKSAARLGQHVDLVVNSSGHGRPGAGSVHHIAFRAADDAEQAEMARRVAALNLRVTPQQDRNYFRSIYFREPGGVLFEIATDPPGFCVDEPLEHLGEGLKLPAQHEHLRARLERELEPL